MALLKTWARAERYDMERLPEVSEGDASWAVGADSMKSPRLSDCILYTVTARRVSMSWAANVPAVSGWVPRRSRASSPMHSVFDPLVDLSCSAANRIVGE
ncbi:hypothetical protein GCM10022206_42960 [Streptomyces chiangmaiensis]